MRKKLKPKLDLESIQSDLIETVCSIVNEFKTCVLLRKATETA